MAKRLDGRKREGSQRRQHICERLLERGYVDVAELSAQLGANVSTIRRDLDGLEAEGAVRRVHGGAYAHAAQTGVEIDFSLRLNFHVDAKRRIAHRAALLINNGDSVYLDAGTTSLMVAEELVSRRSLDVVTNSLAAAEVLRNAKGINLYVVGGRYLAHTRCLIGPMAEQGILAFRFRKMILATAGVDCEKQALTMSSLEEIPIKRAAMAQSDRVIMVADASKFGKPSLISMIPLTNVHTLVTDATPPEAAATVLRNLGVEVITPQD
jgi:DeoR/GlpR family transcriptional regulator of sugar metabolism